MAQAATTIVISQVYGGGGNAGAPYPNDFVELFNPTGTTLSLNGWSIQYASAAGVGLFSVNKTDLAGSLAAGQYYLVQLDSNGAGTNPMPLFDAIGTTDMGASNGKVVLVNTNVGLACNGGLTPCALSDLATIVDLVGFGTADFFESNPAPAPSNTNAILRNPSGTGCNDTNDNSADFATGSPNPRNTSSLLVNCSVVFTSTADANLTGTAVADITNTAVANLTGTAAVNLTGTAISNATGTAASNLTSTASSPTSTVSPPATSTPAGFLSVIINEVAWAGTAASANDEWIELYNPGSTSVNLVGWILRSSDGNPTINLTGSIPPGGYYLLERGDDTTVSDIPADQIYPGDSSTALNNNGEVLQLFDPQNRLIDSANSNGFSWPAGLASTFGTMERRGVITDSDTAWITNTGVISWGLDAGIPNGCTTSCTTAPRALRGTPKHLNWATLVTPTPSITPTTPPKATATKTPIPPPPPPLVAINEFLPRPGRDWNNDGFVNTGDEFIEIINHGTISVNLGGYTLDDEANVGSKPFALPSITLAPGERIVFYGSKTGLLLSDGGDGVRLLKPNGSVMDAYNYPLASYPDQSFCRLPDNGGLDDWNRTCFPSPGLRNSAGGAPGVGSGAETSFCPVADTLPLDFYLAECTPFGNNIWSRPYWDDTGWFGEQPLKNYPGKWEIFLD